jgi:hypothetical protein
MVGVALAMVMSSSAWAAVPIVVVSQDPYTNQTSYHQTEVEPDTYSFGSTIVAAFQVGRFSDGGSSNLGFATTTNNGTSWTNGFMPGTTIYANPPGTWARISDPSVTYDAKHDVWMIVGLVLDSIPSAHGLVVNRSLDGGLTWQNPVNANINQGFYDKQWMTCDNWPASPFYGNCYIEWAGNTGISMTRSTDGGLTWNQSQTPSSGGNGGQPLVQPSGKVVVPYAGNGIQTIVSTNGGSSFTGPFTIATVSTHGPAGGIRAPLLPSAEINGAGKIYVVWPDCRFRTGCAENDIVMTTSADGSTWSTVARIPIDPTTSTVDHFIPGIGADPATSGATTHLGLTYYFYPQTNCNSSTCKLQIGYVSSTDDGTTWSAVTVVGQPMKLTWLPSTTLGYMVGDYISTSFGSNGKAYPVVAQAKTTPNCTISQVGSCHEFMISARSGLSVGPGTIPVNPHEKVLFQPRSGSIRIPTLW